MNREEIIRLAEEAGLIDPDLGECVTDYGDATDSIRRFAALVAAAEREACAQVAESAVGGGFGKNFATAIRARGAIENG
jgi:hypothetical protein